MKPVAKLFIGWLVMRFGVSSAPISITITSPRDGSTVSGTVQLTALCSPNVVRVEWYMDGKLIGVSGPQIPPAANLRVLNSQ